MATVTIREAKTNLSRLIRQACQGEEIVIARGSEPMVRLVPFAKPRPSMGCRKPGVLRGKFKVGQEFFDPLPPDELENWE